MSCLSVVRLPGGVALERGAVLSLEKGMGRMRSGEASERLAGGSVRKRWVGGRDGEAQSLLSPTSLPSSGLADCPTPVL